MAAKGAAMDTPGQTPGSSKIQHSTTQLGGAKQPPTPESVQLEPASAPVMDSGPAAANKIRAFGRKKQHEEEWSRSPNTTGTGAIHVRTFHCKLTDDALVYMDQCINEWLDAHPQYEVKFVTSSVGVLTGKLKEPHMICQVWV
jgi:hypothetical protein